MVRLRPFLLTILAFMPFPAMAQGLATATSPAIPWLRIALAFGFCLALAIAAIGLLRHHQGRLRLAGLARRFPALRPAPRRQITVIESRRVSQHGDVCLLHCHGHSYLIALGQGDMLLLDRQPLPPGDKGPGDAP